MPPKKRRQSSAQQENLPPEGGRIKRTPRSSFDPAAGENTYDIESILSERSQKNTQTGVFEPHFQVRWRVRVLSLVFLLFPAFSLLIPSILS